MTVNLIIKSAAQSVEDFTLTCEMTWTIGQVKDQISALYPTKPKREHQKLIYGGKLLPDDLTLKSILNQTQDIYVLHLVCSLPFVTESEKKNNDKKNSVPPVCTAPPPLSTGGVYSQMNQPILTASGLTSGITGIANTVGGTPDAVQQYLAMQQMYTQLMTQYFAQYNGSAPYPPITPPVQQPQTTVPQQNVPPNAARRQPEEEEDYIDYIYAFVRILVLSVLLLYYSSFTRVFAVTLMVLLITIFAKMNRQHQREQMQRANARQASENTTAQQRTPSNGENENQVSEDTASTESTSTETQAQVPSSPSVPSTIFTLVTAFFSSLIPSDPLPVNVN